MAVPGIALIAHQNDVATQGCSQRVEQAGLLRKVGFVLGEESLHIASFPQTVTDIARGTEIAFVFVRDTHRAEGLTDRSLAESFATGNGQLANIEKRRYAHFPERCKEITKVSSLISDGVQACHAIPINDAAPTTEMTNHRKQTSAMLRFGRRVTGTEREANHPAHIVDVSVSIGCRTTPDPVLG